MPNSMMSDDSLKAETNAGDRKISYRWYAVPVAVFLVGALSFGMLAWTSYLNERQRSHFALANALMDMQNSVATSHLWLEEYLAEAEQGNLEKAVENHAEAVRLSKAILNGGESEHGYVLSPLQAPDLRMRAEDIAGQLSELQVIADKRLYRPEGAGPGSYLDEHFDQVFTGLQGRIKDFEEFAEKKQEDDYAQTKRLFYGLFIAWSFIVVAATVGLWHLESRRRQAEMRQDQLVGELACVNQELKNFAATVSHDLKAPLRAIGSLAGWLVTDYSDKFDDKGKRQVNLLINRVKRLDSLIGCIFEYSRAGCDREERTEVELNRLVSNAIDMLNPPKNIMIAVMDVLPTVVCQKARIEQVFQNLLSNAIKYMDKPAGEIRIGCVAESGFWKFSVADNGPGIEEKYFEKIFRLFETLKSRDSSESTGFGLALVKKIVEMYGGRVWVESTVGQGSVFYFTVKKDTVNVS